MSLNKSLRLIVSVALLVCVSTFLASNFLYCSDTKQSEVPEPLEKTASDVSAKADTVRGVKKHAEYEFVRHVPEQRVPLQPGAAKTTVLDLPYIYEKIDQLQGSKLVYSIEEYGKTNIVAPELQNDELYLHWKSNGTSQITLKIESPDDGRIFYDRIPLKAWSPNYWSMLFAVLGGLGIFLLGMRYMSDGLQMVAGPSLRTMIATITENRFSAVLVGFVVTFLIQSSSVTTVMVVGFINSQIMTLAQGIGVIMGANIGTTVTGWILTLNIGKYGLPMLGAAALVYMFSKIERTRFLAMVVMGLGFVFFGLELMQEGFVPLRELPEFTEMMETFSADTYGGVLLCAGIGCLMTLVVQSSSATLGITISLAAIGVIQFETAAALVLGENVGTTITAVLASIGSTTNAKRAAYFHVVFNLVGVFWATAAFRIFLVPLITHLVGLDPQTGLIRDPKIGIALTHTMFNIANTVVFLPFTGIAAILLTRFVKETKNDQDTQSRLTTLAVSRLETPAMAIERSRIEVLRMGNSCVQLTDKVMQIIYSDAEEPDQKLVDEAFLREETLDTLQDEIIEYTAALLSGNISHDIAEAAHQQLRMADELESISDYLITILKSDLKLRKDGLSIPEPQKSDFRELHSSLKDYIALVVQFYSNRRTAYGDLMTEVNAQGRSFTRKVKTVRDIFIKRMSDEKFDPQVVIAFNTQLNAFRRVREHAQNVAEAIVGAK